MMKSALSTKLKLAGTVTRELFEQWSCFGLHLLLEDDDEQHHDNQFQVMVPTLETVFYIDDYAIHIPLYSDDKPFYNRQTLSSQIDFVFKLLI